MPRWPIALQRLAYRAGFRLLKVYWFVLRPQTHGVKLFVWSQGELLFVRHTYGDRAMWEVPGGGRKRGESPAAAATREAREELGIELSGWHEFGEVFFHDYASAHLVCLSTEYAGRDVHPHPAEIGEVRWCPPQAPPQPLGRHAVAAMRLPAFAVLEGEH